MNHRHDIDTERLRSKLENLPSETLADLLIPLLEGKPYWIDMINARIAAHWQPDDEPIERGEVLRRVRAVIAEVEEMRDPWAWTWWLDDLKRLERRGDAIGAEDRESEAAVVYGALLEALVDTDADHFDFGVADYADFLLRLTNKLLDIFRRLPPDEKRRPVLLDLWRAWRHDASIGGSVAYDFLWDAFLDDTTKEERKVLANLARTDLESGFPHPAMPEALLRDLSE